MREKVCQREERERERERWTNRNVGDDLRLELFRSTTMKASHQQKKSHRTCPWWSENDVGGGWCGMSGFNVRRGKSADRVDSLLLLLVKSED